VWVSDSKSSQSEPKKIAAVGVHLRRNISSYGVGFNITEEPMWFFRQIVACGLEGREATSLEGQGVQGITMEDVAEKFVNSFVKRLNVDFYRPGAKGERIESVYRVEEEDILRR